MRHGYSHRSASPAALTATLAVHIIIIAAIVMIPGVKIVPPEIWNPIETSNIPIEPDPPAVEPQRADQPSLTQKPTLTSVPSMVDTSVEPKSPVIAYNKFANDILPVDVGGVVDGIEMPVFVQAVVDPGFAEAFQPDYPGTMVRAGIEGFAKIRVFIDDKGRVTAAELIEATDDAFWKAARRQAVKYWRFKPATRDGLAVASEQIMVIRFRLDDIR